jgi:hypothetical protein
MGTADIGLLECLSEILMTMRIIVWAEETLKAGVRTYKIRRKKTPHHDDPDMDPKNDCTQGLRPLLSNYYYCDCHHPARVRTCGLH